ncbi:MAG: mandelate racemase/muconate lactonizing enzyme family protein [Granulosicoccus sp.]
MTSQAIERVDVFVVKAPLDVPFAFSQGWVHQRAATLVRITTKSGIQGWGEAFAQGLEPPEIAAAAVSHALVPRILGQDALSPSVIWHTLYNQTRDHGRKGSVMSAISAVDIALWDICGKHHGVPINTLLGGAFRQSVQPYATGFYRLSGQGESPRLADEALGHKESGFRAMKIKLGFGVRDDIAVMHSIVKALDDTSIELMVDANHAYGRRDAIRLGQALQDFDLRWYEEPVVPEDIEGYAELRRRLDLPIAGGENEHSGYGFNALFRADALDVAQPDLGSCGGFTAAKDILGMAQANGVMVNPHVWGTAIAQAASLQFISAMPVAHHSLFAAEPLLEYDISSHPFRLDLIDEPWQMVNGRVAIPTKPGLGIDINMDTIERYKTQSDSFVVS